MQWLSCFALLSQQVALCSQSFCLCSGLWSGFGGSFVQWLICFTLLSQQIALCSQAFCLCSGLWSALWCVFCAVVKLFYIVKSASSFVQSVILFV